MRGLSLMIFTERYAWPDEDWEGACTRLAQANSKAEMNGKVALFAGRFAEQLRSGKFMPGGRFWYGSGRKVQQTMNCYVAPVEDAIEGWGKLMADVATISARGGGVGINFSPIRPRGYPISGMGGTTTGAVSLMKIVNAIGEEIKDGGGRRAALMFCLDINHPDVEEFLDAKMEVGEISNANISVMIPADMPTEKFVEMVRENGQIPLMFNGLPDKLGRSLGARELWEWLVGNAWDKGEPGLLNWYLVQKMNNIGYVRDLIATNPCGEQPLSGHSNCCLGHLVLPRFVSNGAVNWAELDESVRLAVRFLDNAIDVAAFPIPENEKVAREERRIGLGVMGLHTMLLDLGMKYDSPEAFKFVDKLMSTIKNTAYDASINLAIEKGPFPLYDPKMLDGGFVKTLKPGIKHKIREHGIRNCCLLTVAPTGTTSMVQGVTGGIEPVFSPVYIRRRRVVDKKQRDTLVETLVVSEEYLDHPEIVQGAYDIHPRAHMEMQKIVQKHVDSAVSKCVAEGTLIPTDRGLIPIEQMGEAEVGEFGTLHDDFEVIGHDGEHHNVTGFYANGMVDTIRMRTQTGAVIEASEKHQMLTVDGWKAMPDIKIGDGIVGRFAEMHSVGGEPIRFDAEMRTNAKPIDFPISMDVRLAKWLGMMCADGHTVESSGNVGLTAKSRCGTPEAVFASLSVMFGSPMRDTVDGRTGVLVKSMTSRNLARYVEALIGKGAAAKRVPEQILRGSADEKRAFLEGVTLDGYVTPRGLTLYSGISADLADGIEALCRSFGLPTVWRWTETKKDGYVVHKVAVDGKMQEELTPVEEHKRQPAKHSAWLVPVPEGVFEMSLPTDHPNYSALRNLKQRQSKWCKATTLDALGVEYDPEVYVTKVASLEESSAMTYDIEVEEAHSYVVNGLVSHNTINLPKDFPKEELSELWLEYLPHLKGTTFYREGSREVGDSYEPMKHVPADEIAHTIAEWQKSGKEIEYEISEVADCATGSCDI